MKKSWRKILLTGLLTILGSQGLREVLPHNKWTDLATAAAAAIAGALVDPRKKAPGRKLPP